MTRRIKKESDVGRRAFEVEAKESMVAGKKIIQPLDVEHIRKDFPALKIKVYGKSLAYLDNAATTQKPQCVIDRMNRYFETENSNVHRGVHHLSQVATQEYEEARGKVQRFLGAAEAREIIFVRGATEGINLVAHSYGRKFIKKGDEVIISHIEHHSNIVPWQMLCEETGAKLRVIPVNYKGELIMEEYDKLLSERTKIVAVGHISNALGTINPIKEIIQKAHKKGARVLIDGAQAVPHTPVNVKDLDCDFYIFSGHKLFGPTGIGVVYGKAALLESMPPYQGGGDMISFVTFEKTHYNIIPYKFEAGTPHIAGVIGLGEAVDYVESIGLEKISAYEQDLLDYATGALSEVKDIRFIGTAEKKASIISFNLGNIHAHDVGTILDRDGVAVRAGHHCAMPVMERFGVPATVRASLAFYNTREEIDRLVSSLEKVRSTFS